MPRPRAREVNHLARENASHAAQARAVRPAARRSAAKIGLFSGLPQAARILLPLAARLSFARARREGGLYFYAKGSIMKTTIQSTLLVAGLCGALTSPAFADPTPEHKHSGTHQNTPSATEQHKQGTEAQGGKNNGATADKGKNKNKQNAAKMTCTDFLALDEVVKPKLVYWAEGYNKKGKPDNAEFDVITTDRLVPVLVEVCKKAPQEQFLKKANEEANKQNKQAQHQANNAQGNAAGTQPSSHSK
jgi:hypothetical protein